MTLKNINYRIGICFTFWLLFWCGHLRSHRSFDVKWLGNKHRFVLLGMRRWKMGRKTSSYKVDKYMEVVSLSFTILNVKEIGEDRLMTDNTRKAFPLRYFVCVNAMSYIMYSWSPFLYHELTITKWEKYNSHEKSIENYFFVVLSLFFTFSFFPLSLSLSLPIFVIVNIYSFLCSLFCSLFSKITCENIRQNILPRPDRTPFS